MTKVQLTKEPSPISPAIVASAAASLSSVRSDGNNLFVVITDPNNQGRASILTSSSSNPSSWRTITPEGANVRSAVHEYGGGPFAIVPNGSGVVYTDFPSHKVYWKKLDESPPMQLYPPTGEAGPCRFADFTVCSFGNNNYILFAVMEDHTNPKPDQVLNSLVSLSMDGSGTITILASGKDFYAAPKAILQDNSNIMHLAYVAWDHPNMPWDHTSLFLQRILLENSDDKPIFQPSGEPQLIFGSASSVASPVWSPDKNSLYFISDITGWYNIYRYDLQTKKTNPLLPREADFCESGSFGWLLGLTHFSIFDDGRLVAGCSPPPGREGESSDALLAFITVGADGVPSNITEVPVGSRCLPPTAVGGLCVCGTALCFLGGSTNDPVALWRWGSPGDETCVAQPVFTTVTEDMAGKLDMIKPFLSTPQRIKFKSDGQIGLGYAYGYFYEPTNNPAPDIKPPLLVKAHGGPTSSTSTTFRLDIQYWASRGYAILDVDYGGSSGYGKEFRESLKGQWGLLDVADVCAGAKYCVDQKWVNDKWLCIDGKSAGGYTTLAVLAFQDTFHAGASLYGVGDLSALVADTHKFESRYLDNLIGPFPERKDLYDARCPILKADKLNCPVILLQG
jgi:hypothetical protein